MGPLTLSCLRRLSNLATESKSLEFSDEAKERLHAHRLHCREMEALRTGKALSSLGKVPGQIVRLATVLAFLDWSCLGGEEPTQILADHVDRAAIAVITYHQEVAQKSLGSESPEMASARKLARLILEEGLEEFTPREIYLRERSALKSVEAVTSALTVLERHGWGRVQRVPTGGRPQTIFVVNPLLWHLRKRRQGGLKAPHAAAKTRSLRTSRDQAVNRHPDKTQQKSKSFL